MMIMVGPFHVAVSDHLTCALDAEKLYGEGCVTTGAILSKMGWTPTRVEMNKPDWFAAEERATR